MLVSLADHALSGFGWKDLEEVVFGRGWGFASCAACGLMPVYRQTRDNVAVELQSILHAR